MTTQIKINSEPVTELDDILDVINCYLAVYPLQPHNQIGYRDGHLYCQPRGNKRRSDIMFAGDDVTDYAADIAQ